MVAANTSHSNQTVLEQVGPNIIHHVSNSDIAHPIIHLPSFFGIDFSVTKHVLMLWLVALIVSIVVIIPTRKYLSSNGKKKSNWVTLIEYIVEFVKDTIAAPNVSNLSYAREHADFISVSHAMAYTTQPYVQFSLNSKAITLMG